MSDKDTVYRQAAIQALDNAAELWNIAEPYHEGIRAGYKNSARLIMSLPSAQPERKKGKWDFVGDQVFVCTECGACYSQSQFEYLRTRKSDPEFPYFCPNCGADMRGDADETDS